jgi:threonylcarbamoyladenosine tRNA methylthiotransferase MtaB
MPEQPTVSILTLGCKLNQADAETIARSLISGGVRVVGRPEKGADAFVINTCSVTHVADRKARHLTRLARRLSGDYRPQAATRRTASVAALTGADFV